MANNISVYRIQEGDKLRPLAQKLLGDFNRWTELVELNKLNYPYLGDPASYPTKKVLGVGDDLLFAAPTQLNKFENITESEAERRAYGIDLQTDTQGYFNLVYDKGNPVPTTGGATLSLVQGVDNLAQALFHRMNTRVGELPAHPTDYGHTAWQYIGSVGDLNNLELIAQAIQKCIKQNEDILKVTTKAVYNTGDSQGVVSVESEIIPRPPARALKVTSNL